MKQKKILILSASNPNGDPRPNRMINWLKDDYSITVVGATHTEIEGVNSFALAESNKKNGDTFADTIMRIAQKYSVNLFRYIFFLLLKKYGDITETKYSRIRYIQEQLSKEDFDLIISHDLILLPLVFKIKGNKNTKVMLDAREFYPKNFDDNFRWRLFTKPINEFLCDEYLHRCDKIITVSDGLAKEYAEEYDIQPEVVMSLPYAYDLQPVKNTSDTIKIIYHGYANSSRKTELMVEMMDFVDEHFTLDLMLSNAERDSYRKKIKDMAKARKNVRVIPSVKMQEIVPFTNKYDIGLFLCPPTNFNLTYALPNKFFEYIQARLAIAIGPSIEMEKITKKYDCGVVAKDFEPRSLADELNQLTHGELAYYKEQSHKAAQILNAETNKGYVDKMIAVLLTGEKGE